jgi:PAS domain S-box-containing protein
MARKVKRTAKSDPVLYVKEHFEHLFTNPAAAIIIIDTKGYVRYINDYVLHMTKYRKKDILGKKFTKFIPVESRSLVNAAFSKLQKGKEIAPYEFTVHNRDKSQLYIKATATPLIQNGKVIGMIGFATNNTIYRTTVDHLSKMVKELSFLYTIGKELASTINLDLLFSKILMYLSNTFGYERAGILLVDQSGKYLRIRASTKPFPDWRRERKIRLGQGVTGHVAKTGKPYLSNNTKKEKRYVTFDRKTKSEITVPLKHGKKTIGVINVERYQYNAFDENDLHILTLIANQAAIAIENSRLYESLEESYLDTIKALVSAMEAKDHYTRGHSERVRQYAIRIAQKLDLDEKQMKDLNYAGYLHDIGKIGIKDSLLSKVEPLTEEEYELIKKHPDIGDGILRDVKHLSSTCAIIRCEHERFDGNGYPSGLRKQQIPLGARIIAVADAYDAMITDRPYRRAITKTKAIEVLKKESGKQFDPEVVRAFLGILKRPKQ